MQLASRQCLWKDTGLGVEVVLDMTNETGRYIKFLVDAIDRDKPVVIQWGDGTSPEKIDCPEDRTAVEHTYAANGRYRVLFQNIGRIMLRWLDGHPQYNYDNSVISIVDQVGILTGFNSGAFKSSTRLEQVIAPAANDVGQRPFAYCTSLKK